MKSKTTLLLALVIFCGQLSAGQGRTAPTIVPIPVEIVTGNGYFTLSPTVSIDHQKKENAIKRVAGFLREYIADATGMQIAGKPGNGRKISLYVDPVLGEEEYILDVKPEVVVICGGSDRAIFYGVQSFRQLVNQYKPSGEAKSVQIPAIYIRDRPAFGYRGAMLDVCRHFRPVEDVKRYIDILAMHKMNTFHWHLTEDQGWRIAVDKYPELITVASTRDSTLIGHLSWEPREYDHVTVGGYYTKEQMKEVVDYAAERFITVIPELEMPGHASAALTAYPNLGCVGSGYRVEPHWGVFDDVFCAGKEEVFTFLEDVLEVILEVFPSEYIHIGGDECPKKRWKECPHCQKRIQEEGLADEHELQSYFMRRMERWLNGRGRKVIGWDEILEGGLSPTATVMSWRGSKGGIEAAKSGNYVIMTPNTHCYIDYCQAEERSGEPVSSGRFTLPVERTYALDPYEGLNENEQRFILGVQCNLWCEYIKTMDHVEYMALPRLAAVAETGWSYGNKNYEDFAKRMQILAQLYDIYGYNYAHHIFPHKEPVKINAVKFP